MRTGDQPSTFEDVLTLHYRLGEHTLTSGDGFYNYHFKETWMLTERPCIVNLQVLVLSPVQPGAADYLTARPDARVSGRTLLSRTTTWSVMQITSLTTTRRRLSRIPRRTLRCGLTCPWALLSPMSRHSIPMRHSHRSTGM